MREEVCAPGEFNLTIPLEAGKREREREELLQERTGAKKWKLGRRRKSKETDTWEEFFYGIFQDHVSPQGQS